MRWSYLGSTVRLSVVAGTDGGIAPPPVPEPEPSRIGATSGDPADAAVPGNDGWLEGVAAPPAEHLRRVRKDTGGHDIDWIAGPSNLESRRSGCDREQPAAPGVSHTARNWLTELSPLTAGCGDTTAPATAPPGSSPECPGPRRRCSGGTTPDPPYAITRPSLPGGGRAGRRLHDLTAPGRGALTPPSEVARPVTVAPLRWSHHRVVAAGATQEVGDETARLELLDHRAQEGDGPR